MEWDIIKDKYYYEDETLRDIVAEGVAFKSWIFFIKMINKDYTSKVFCNYKPIKQRLNMEIAKKGFNSKDSYYATIDINGVEAHLYFFPNIATLDIIPKNIDSMEKHIALEEFMNKMVKVLRRDVHLTKEGSVNDKLFTIEYQKPEEKVIEEENIEEENIEEAH